MKDKFAVTPEQLGRIGKLNRVRSDEEVTLAMVENGNITAANIVKQYGDQYLPIFARMDDELKKSCLLYTSDAATKRIV